MMVRIAAFITSSLLWSTEKFSEGEIVFQWLFYLEFSEWLEGRRVTDTIFNQKTLAIANALANLFNDQESIFYSNPLSKEELKDKTREDKSYSKFTYQAYRKEYVEGQLSSFIMRFVLKRRTLQGRAPDRSNRRRSSEDSKGNKEKNFHGIPPSNEVPYVREVEKSKLLELANLVPSVRRTSLQESG